jgi:hypothetical protein
MMKKRTLGQGIDSIDADLMGNHALHSSTPHAPEPNMTDSRALPTKYLIH